VAKINKELYMEKLLQIVMYFSWALWLVYSYGILFRRRPKPDPKMLLPAFIGLLVLIVLLKSRMMIVFTSIALLIVLFGMFRKSSREQAKGPPAPAAYPYYSWLHSFIGMLLTTIVLVSLFFFLSGDFQSNSNYFIERYHFKIEPGKKEIMIGNSKEDSDITLENASSDKAHLRLLLAETDFFLQNVSDNKKVDVNGRYLNKLVLKQGDEVEIRGKEKIKVLKTHSQYPLGRSLRVSIKGPGQEKGRTVTLHTLLNKPFFIQYRRTPRISAGLNKISIPGRLEKSAAVTTYEPNRRFLGLNIYYMIVFFVILLLSTGIYLYLKNRFNGAVLLLLMAFLPFMAGMVSPVVQGIITLAFLPAIIYVGKRRKTPWSWGAALLVLLFAAVFALPHMLRMGGDFTFRYYDFSEKESIQVTRGNETFQLKDIKKKLPYDKKHRLILGHTAYELVVTKDKLSLMPLNPEKIRISPHYKAIICDLNRVVPGNDYIYLKFPHEFEPIAAAAAAGKERLIVTGGKGNSITLSKIVNDNYKLYLRGLGFFIIIPFCLFWLITHVGLRTGKERSSRLKLFNPSNFVIYNFVYFMLGLGYVIFGALALYNNSYLRNFEKFRTQALPLFVGLFFLALVLSRYNRWPVFLYRVLKQKKYHVPLMVGIALLLLVNYHRIFLYAGILFLMFVFLIRLRKDLIYEYKNAGSYPLNIKTVIEKTISSFENPDNQRIFFGLGRTLNNKGWNYLLVSDLLLLLALFFIVLQVFLGGELGVAVAGFFFLPIELGKILLTIYFADWVSRIDKGMELNVSWIYGLVLIPFFLLIIFLKDFSPLVVFSFVFFYHIVKIDRPLKFKLLLMVLIAVTLVITVTGLGNYAFPLKYLSVIVSILSAVLLLRVWFRKTLKIPVKILLSLVLVLLLGAINYVSFFRAPMTPRSLGNRVSSWLDPWQDYNLSYQYVNSLWLMKGTGTFGKSTDALTTAHHVPLIEKDLSFSLYISVLGTIGTVFIFFTLFMIAAYVHKLAHQYGEYGRGSPFRWYLYVMEFLAVIFLAQFLVPALYVMGLLPVMGQPLPFLSYSNNMLLLFALPFSFLMIVLGNNLAAEDFSHREI
jgi:cell division protein FtsW (lipid II flippase)